MPITISTTINGEQQELTVRPNQTLLECLRDDLSLKGSVEGCGVSVCGSCTVLVDGRPVSSCLMLATNAEGRNIITIEGLSRDDQLWLLKRIARSLRRPKGAVNAAWNQSLAEMAADADIQREIQAIA